ncbi:hypothetical protein JTT00_11100 [Clostridium botulinum]|nr:hypothetical protein [Clostridium botulinum]MCS4470464.1 hypothetical protein [Clostridium botulinum]MCS4522093.1 hypothetical protein [Clostridium botulinum]
MNEYKSLRKVGKVLGVSHTTVMNKIKNMELYVNKYLQL